MIPVSEAVAKSREYAQQWLGSSDVLLEEVEPATEDGIQVWRVTLSLPRRSAPPKPDTGSFSFQLPGSVRDLIYGTREYKVFTVDATTGDVRSMRIRDFGR